MSLLDDALKYAQMGWHVFPVHTIKNGGCDCWKAKNCTNPGKHPRISNGFNGATTDIDTIKRWWEVWPESNIGIATGLKSGIVVLDVDEGGEDSLQGKDIPDSVEQITGSGGRHIIFKRPDDDLKYKSSVKFLPGLDSRADGGYIIVPPSRHISGNVYEWEGSSDPTDGAVLNDPPAWFLEAITSRVDNSSVSAEMPDWNPDGELPPNIMEMLATIPSDEYETWRDVGMALHFTDPNGGLAVWDWWSGRSANYDGDAVLREWANFSRRGHKTSNPVTMGKVKLLADKYGWHDPSIEHGATVSKAFMESHQRKIMERIQSAEIRQKDVIEAPDLMPKSGLIRDIAQYILSTGRYPQERLAVAASISYLAALMGRKYKTDTNLRSNFYIVGIADSGHGKDHARKSINNLAAATQTDEYIGGSTFASGPGLLASLQNHPSRVFMVDEFGKFIQGINGKNSPGYKAEIVKNLLELFSSAGTVYRGAEYADQSKKPRIDIVNPNVCIYGTSVPDAFWSAMSSSDGVDGTLSRMVIIEAPTQRPNRQKPLDETPSQGLVDAIIELRDYMPGNGNLEGLAGGYAGVPAQLVPMNEATEAAWNSLDDDMTEHMKGGIDSAIYSRVPENTAKLAMVYAISRDIYAPVIDEEAFQWAREIMLWAANIMVKNIDKNVADTESGRDYKKILGWIEDKKSGMSRTAVYKKNRNNIKNLDEIIRVMLSAGDIVEMTPTKTTAGRTATILVSADNLTDVIDSGKLKIRGFD